MNGKKSMPKVSEFFAAVREGNLKRAKEKLKDGVDINSKDYGDLDVPTALTEACKGNDVNMVKTLLSFKPKRADVNAETTTGRRPIWWAVDSKNHNILELLLRWKCDVNAIDKVTGRSPLLQAIGDNHPDVVRQLVHAGADVNLRQIDWLSTTVGSYTPLMKAVEVDNVTICEILLNSLCRINARTERGVTALHIATLLRRYDICQLLAENRVKMTPVTNSGVTPLALATEYRDPAMCRLLLQNGAKMDHQYKWGETPLEHAINIHNETCAMTLVHLGCRLKRRQGKQSYFYMAIREKLLNLAELLAAIEPQFFNEHWIQSREWPVSIFYNPGICNWLVSKANKPGSLMELCRSRIFRTLGRYSPKKCTLLPLPETLRSYVTFSQFMHDSFYELQPIINFQCPYDCAVKCRRRNCGDLDIYLSDESDSELMYDES